MNEQLVMGTLLLTGLILFSGLVHQLVTGLRLRQHDAKTHRGRHRVIGYTLVVLALVHLPLGVLDAMEVLLP